MELSEVRDDPRHQLREECFPHPGALAPAPAEHITFGAADIFDIFDIFEIFCLPHACRGNTTQPNTLSTPPEEDQPPLVVSISDVSIFETVNDDEVPF